MKRIWDNHVKGAYFIGHLNDHKRNVFFYPSIWEKIVEIAPLQSQWRKRIPGKWLPLEHELLQHKERGERIMTIEELQNINSSLAVPLDGIGDIKLFLRYVICLYGSNEFIRPIYSRDALVNSHHSVDRSDD